jgi:hypothetical protein
MSVYRGYIPGCLRVLQLILPEQIYTGEQPFRSIQNDMAVVLQVWDQKSCPPRPSSSGLPDGARAMSDGLWAIVEACWAHKPSDRPDMGTVLGLIVVSS